ncbi:MAG: pyruvate formate lyase-activating protein [Candidatus Pacebacteria bacterium]|nr:pyruvate formate lyase-activating protein [Candidatus Paceibacterota bacterium]
MKKLLVHSIESFGTQDGPGIRLVIFTQGCNFNCLYCQNVDTKALTSDKAKEMTIEEIINLLEKQKPYFKRGGGLTVSGGEPTFQSEFLTKLFKECKKRGFHTALDTNGGIYSSQIKELYDNTDLVILDVKHIDNDKHKQLCGVENINVLKNAQYREDSNKPMILRYVMVPGWNDESKYLEEWGETFSGYKNIEQVELLPYHTLGVHKFKELGLKYKLDNVQPPTTISVEKAEQILKKYFPNVVVK